ncbi:MAG TPA: caspase family protein, partial [Bacteroidia bacterium]|nr:caspase family protein [Bacteroidia bacterium]
NPLASRSFMATRSNSGGLKGYADGTLPEATMIMYAAAPGKVALDGANGNSPFTEAFVRNIEKRDQTMYEAFLNTSDEVVDATGGRQEPWLNAHGAGRTFRGMAFAIPGSVDASTLAAAVPAPAAPQVEAPAGFPAQMPVQATAPAIQPAAAVGPYLSNAPGSAPTLPPSVMSAIMQGNSQFPATLAPVGSAPVTTTPLEPIPMPERGYFTNDEVFQQGPYQEYNSWSRREILKAAQKKMETGADGKMGKGTQAAITAYQLGNNLTPSGLLDAPTIAALDLGGIEETAASSSSGGSSRKYSSSGSRKSSGRSGSYRRGGGGGDQLLKAAAGAAIIYGIYRAAR